MTAIFFPSLFDNICFNNDVFPAPKNPDRIVIGMILLLPSPSLIENSRVCMFGSHRYDDGLLKCFEICAVKHNIPCDRNMTARTNSSSGGDSLIVGCNPLQ